MIDLNLLKEKTGAKVCFTIAENKVILGDIENPDDALERISLVLKQTLSALGVITFRYIIIEGKDEYVLLMIKGKEINGLVLPLSKEIEETLRVYYEVAGTRAEEKVEEVVEEQVAAEVVLLSPEILDKLKEIARKHLGDFADDVFHNTLEDLEINEENLTKDNLMEFIQGFEKSAGMLIGPSRAGKMKDEMVTIIKEG